MTTIALSPPKVYSKSTRAELDGLITQRARALARAYVRGQKIKSLFAGTRILTGVLADTLQAAAAMAETGTRQTRRIADLEHALAVEEEAHAKTRLEKAFAVGVSTTVQQANKGNPALTVLEQSRTIDSLTRQITALQQQIDTLRAELSALAPSEPETA